MTYDPPDETPVAETTLDIIAQRPRAERATLTDLVRVLVPHAGGLRRWSVMRAIRTERERAGRDVSPKFEADIERVFRRYCTGSESGEVWAVLPARAKAWLEAESAGAA
jgi:hypothetical protein